MVDLGFPGSALAVVLGFIAVIWFYIPRSGCRSKDETNDPATTSTTTTTVYNGESRSKDGNDDIDIIIVGAGVAGAALAHTLGKVLFLPHPSLKLIIAFNFGPLTIFYVHI